MSRTSFNGPCHESHSSHAPLPLPFNFQKSKAIKIKGLFLVESALSLSSKFTGTQLN